MKKRSLAVLLAAAMILQLCFLPGCTQQPSGEADQKALTRGEWIALLGRTLGMSDHQGNTPYYLDIDPTSEFYPYIQSCCEWGVLSGDGQFNADEAATPEFVAVTAALATGTVPDDILGDEAAIKKYAKEHGLLPDNGKTVSAADALNIAESAQQTYMDDHHEQVTDITWADGVVDLTQSSNVSMEGTQVTIPEDQAESLTVGSVFMVPAPDGTMIARKVTSLSTENGQRIVQTEVPDLGEVFDELTLYDSAAPDPADAILADGVTIGPVADPLAATSATTDIYIDDLVNRGTDQATAIGTESSDFVLEINISKGNISSSKEPDSNQLTVDQLIPSFADDSVIGASPREQLDQIFKKSNFTAADPFTISNLKAIDEDGWSSKLNMKNQYEAGYEITGSIGIHNFYIEPGFEFKKIFGIPTGIKRVSLEVNGDFITELTLKGHLSEELSIATIPVPVWGIGTVQVELLLYVDASGELQIKAEVKNNVKFEYSDGNIKKARHSEQSSSCEATLDAECGPKLKFTLEVCWIPIIDAEISIGVNFSFDATEKVTHVKNVVSTAEGRQALSTWTGSIAFESHLRLPIITLKVGQDSSTLANFIGIRHSWVLISEEEAPLDWRPPLLNFDVTLWTYTETKPLPDDGQEEENRFNLKQYILVLTDTAQQIELEALDGKPLPKIRWASENPGIATVDSSGRVTPVSGGVTVISAADEENPDIILKCTVIVQDAVNNKWEFLPPDMDLS